MLTKNTIKYVKSLCEKKFRTLHGSFIAEGPKIVGDIAGSTLKIEKIFATQEWIEKNEALAEKSDEILIITAKELSAISQLTTPNQVLATVKMPSPVFQASMAAQTLIITLDNIRDPGNLGTIIRIADWFGYNNILCSETSVDAYNPKCVQSTMGSIARVNIYYENLIDVLKDCPGTTHIFGAFLNGENIYDINPEPHGFLIIGNEANGIQPEVAKLVTRQISIPAAHQAGSHAESLNASAATAILCSEFFRNTNHLTKTST
ncbi:MAG TPA: RNA methyltransferase [Bacteroidales bacterium]|nr:RNA methyltransferase [Bacteroidales bacterium]